MEKQLGREGNEFTLNLRVQRCPVGKWRCRSGDPQRNQDKENGMGDMNTAVIVRHCTETKVREGRHWVGPQKQTSRDKEKRIGLPGNKR